MAILRVAIYARVSSEEQAQHGLSIAAQLARLNAWVQENNHILVGSYIDAGISGGKPIEKRPQMAQLLEDVKSGLIDLVIFTKLDRWFRSLKNYYKAQEILDAHNCAWQAVDEDYETLTASGKFKVNIMLSVAENERERTSERIKSIIDYKKSKSEYLAGKNAVPFGYKLENKHLVKNPDTMTACAEFWEQILSDVPYSVAGKSINAKYGVHLSRPSWSRILRSPIYTGAYHGLPDFCEPYISLDDFNLIQSRTKLKAAPTGIAYLFSGLLICKTCGSRLAARSHNEKRKNYIYYNCQNKYFEKCPDWHSFREETVEQTLLDKLFPAGKKVVLTELAPPEKPQKPETPSLHSLQAKMKRLAETYTDGLITSETYRKRLTAIQEEIKAVETAPKSPSEPSYDKIREFIKGDVREVYNRLTRENKRAFWRQLIQTIEVEKDGSFTIHFL